MGGFLSRFELPTIAGLSREETNFMRTFLLILRVAPPAVRVQFDSEFAPGVLQKTLNQQKLKVLQPLKKQRIINQAQWDVLFPNSGRYHLVFFIRKCSGPRVSEKHTAVDYRYNF